MDVIDQDLDTSDDRDVDDALMDKDEIQVLASQSLTIVEDDASLGSSEDQAAVAGLAESMLDGDDDVQYFRSGDGGTLTTYRVVQVGDSDQLPQLVSSPAYSPNSSSQGVLTTAPLTGQFYVIGSPQEVFGTSQVQRSLAPRMGSGLEGGPRAVRRDDKRRATHNEVERRRRDKINTWIVELSKIVPDCVPESTKSPGQSKGGILSKAFKYIMELRTQNSRLADGHKQTETLAHKVKQLQKEVEALQAKNASLEQEVSLLRSQIDEK
ncbi:upstream stimulatory factor 1 isoform X1 [Thrips palmi]|uniref:Upstream stimulatory factor 1 isoform X1 n=2 Tax=Thrips palmi TaxID=161013 RepID=A0A6P8ZLA1_THRPL|nr:upstream stimulatory factor 1 isoform X1 [Thrips palmi]